MTEHTQTFLRHLRTMMNQEVQGWYRALSLSVSNIILTVQVEVNFSDYFKFWGPTV